MPNLERKWRKLLGALGGIEEGVEEGGEKVRRAMRPRSALDLVVGVLVGRYLSPHRLNMLRGGRHMGILMAVVADGAGPVAHR